MLVDEVADGQLSPDQPRTRAPQSRATDTAQIAVHGPHVLQLHVLSHRRPTDRSDTEMYSYKRSPPSSVGGDSSPEESITPHLETRQLNIIVAVKGHLVLLDELLEGGSLGAQGSAKHGLRKRIPGLVGGNWEKLKRHRH